MFARRCRRGGLTSSSRKYHYRTIQTGRRSRSPITSSCSCVNARVLRANPSHRHRGNRVSAESQIIHRLLANPDPTGAENHRRLQPQLRAILPPTDGRALPRAETRAITPASKVTAIKSRRSADPTAHWMIITTTAAFLTEIFLSVATKGEVVVEEITPAVE